jgi:dTDP-glucose 4,6-dehydratase
VRLHGLIERVSLINMAHILITGSKGVVGVMLSNLLRSRGHQVFGIDLMHHDGEIGWEHVMSASDFTYARCDVGNFRELERVFEKVGPIDFVYHTAAEFGRWNGEDYYERVWSSNAIGTKNIIRLQERLKFKLIHFSSSEVYGDYEDVMAEDVMERTEIKQLNDYALSKWVNEQQIRNSFTQHGTESVVVRLFNTFGPGEWYHPYRSVNAKFCYHALMGKPITVYRGHSRTSTYLADTCRTLANIVDNFEPGETYNIGGTEYHDMETLAKIIWNYTKADSSLITYAESEILTTRSKKVDVSKAVRDLQHQTTVSLEDGVKKTIDWMREYYGLK